METASRWATPEHECPHCGDLNMDAWGEIEWTCKTCGKSYKLEKLEGTND